MTVLHATPDTFAEVWSKAAGGDKIVLADGVYSGAGDILNRSNSDWITIEAENKHQAVLDGIFLKNAAYVRFVDIAVQQNGVIIQNSHHIELIGHDIRNVSGMDNMQIQGDSHHILIEGGAFRDNIATSSDAHPDLIQVFQLEGRTPHDITIRGNLFYDDPNTGLIGAQGISISDGAPGGYKNILVEQNLIASVLPNALMIQSGIENVVIQDNTVTQGRIWIINNEGYGNAGTTVRDNVAPILLDDGGGANVIHNYIYGDAPTTDLFSAYVDGGSWEQFLPKIGSPVDFGTNYGALDYLKELLQEPPPPASSGNVIVGTRKGDLIDGSHAPQGQPVASPESDLIFGRKGGDELHGLGGPDDLRGGNGRDQLFGGEGNDVLAGGKGRDDLLGGAGADSFLFKKVLGQHRDLILDFGPGDDKILLSQEVFTALDLGTLTAEQFRDLGEARTATDRIIYKKDGSLLYDEDGKGGHEPIQIATLDTRPDLSSLDLIVVA